MSKCFVYLMHWDLSDGYHRLIEPTEIEGCCSVGDKFSVPVTLTYGDSPIPNIIETESPKTGRRTLGVRIAPAGNWNDEFKYRRQQARTLAQQLNNATISKETAAIAYQMVICPKLEYTLGITQFTQSQCDQITAPVISAVLASLGYNRNMPRTVVYNIEIARLCSIAILATKTLAKVYNPKIYIKRTVNSPRQVMTIKKKTKQQIIPIISPGVRAATIESAAV